MLVSGVVSPFATQFKAHDQRLPRPEASDAELQTALQEANLPTVLLVLAQLTGEGNWLREPFLPTQPIGTDDNDSGGFSPEQQAKIRGAAFDLMRELRDGDLDVPPPPSAERLVEMLSISLAEGLPAEYGETMVEEAGFAERGLADWHGERPDEASRLSVLVIGAGPAGITVAAMLERLGLPYTVVEKNPSVGGVWWENDYPGAGVDTPSHLYSFSRTPNPDWSHFYAKQPELLDYFRRIADELGVLDRIRFRTEVTAMGWDESRQLWSVQTEGADGAESMEVRAVISCVGVLSRPRIPKLPGMDDFEGPVFHSARWDHGLDLAGKLVAVIGTGATAMQIVPSIADRAAHTLVFQRSPQWVAPNANYLRAVPEGTRLLMAHMPYYASFYRLRLMWRFQDKLLASLYRDPEWSHPERSVNKGNDRHRAFFTKHIESELEGRPDLIAKVVPDYPPYGKRILMDNNWYKTLRRDDVTLIADGVQGLDAHHVLTDAGDAYAADVVVLATGFHASRMLWPMDIHGRGGVSLHAQWGDDNASAYLGITVPNFPNLFVVGGPHTFLGHGGSALYTTEAGINYIGQALVALVERRWGSLEVKAQVHDDYNRRLDAEHERLVWTHPGMNTWFRNKHGRVTALSPWRGVDYWSLTHELRLDDFIVEPRRDRST